MISTIDAHIKWHEMSYDDTTVVSPYIYLTINGQEINDTLDYFEFAFDTYRIQRKFIFTCSCGISECAGWFEGFKVKTRKNTVEWWAINPKEAKNTFIRPYHMFNRVHYNAVQKKVIALYEEIVKFRIANPNQHPEFEWRDDTFKPETMEDLQESIAWYRDWVANHHDPLLTRELRCV